MEQVKVLLKILGLYQKDSGAISFNGKAVESKTLKKLRGWALPWFIRS